MEYHRNNNVLQFTLLMSFQTSQDFELLISVFTVWL